MKILRITLFLLSLSTTTFSQSENKTMLSDKVKVLMLEELSFDYDSATTISIAVSDSILKSQREQILKNATVFCGSMSIRYRNPFRKPLIVFDGFTVGYDIEGWEMEYDKSNYEIEVVSGNLATALYGTRGENGVVVISTDKWRRKLRRKKKRRKKQVKN